ncbi:hypothetical protein [Pantoea piersonii]|uniref:hypothetical protein n=1 Tax=Pantoea piersonii TaxID=2364647 RepID=UPI002897C20C|nr:hypothetical protein [Pantoea piersonii]
MQIEKGSQTAALFVFGGEGAVYGFCGCAGERPLEAARQRGERGSAAFNGELCCIIAGLIICYFWFRDCKVQW